MQPPSSDTLVQLNRRLLLPPECLYSSNSHSQEDQSSPAQLPEQVKSKRPFVGYSFLCYYTVNTVRKTILPAMTIQIYRYSMISSTPMSAMRVSLGQRTASLMPNRVFVFCKSPKKPETVLFCLSPLTCHGSSSSLIGLSSVIL